MLTKSGFQSENWIVGTKELKDGGKLFSNGSKFFESEWNRHSVSRLGWHYRMRCLEK